MIPSMAALSALTQIFCVWGLRPLVDQKNVVIIGADSNGNGFDGYVEFLDASGTVVSTLQFTGIETIVPCFIPGSRFETDRGPVLVEILRRGDRVLTKDQGFQPLVWVGHKTLTQQALAAAPHLRPIRISAGALGARAPLQDVCVTSASHVDQW
ncbi:Hint domain-containing protein [Pseudorhodobacter antarcticus]|uniref:Hint domain-containing protein n=1 Tax=Pseudorhodobacter antarcticus TaxID=1077947 RepID=A0A1H8G5T9_9RHOB|nr:Hint domain-containing protein [Pseudorhodobacter antarcticus]